MRTTIFDVVIIVDGRVNGSWSRHGSGSAVASRRAATSFRGIEATGSSTHRSTHASLTDQAAVRRPRLDWPVHCPRILAPLILSAHISCRIVARTRTILHRPCSCTFGHTTGHRVPTRWPSRLRRNSRRRIHPRARRDGDEFEAGSVARRT